jgi:hypothetical protein
MTPLLATAANISNPTSAEVTNIILELSAQSVCAIHEKYCLGANQQVLSHF